MNAESWFRGNTKYTFQSSQSYDDDDDRERHNILDLEIEADHSIQ